MPLIKRGGTSQGKGPNLVVWQRDESLRYQPRLSDGRVLIRAFGRNYWKQPEQNQLAVLYRSRNHAIRIAIRNEREIQHRNWKIRNEL